MLRITLNILSRWYWLLIITTLAAGITVYLILDQQPPVYRGSSLLLVGPSTSSANPELNDLRTSGQLLETYAVLATTRPVLEGIVTELELGITYDQLLRMIEITTTPETQILRVRVTAPSEEQALSITNTLAARILQFSPLGPESSEDSPFRTQLLEQVDRLQERISNSEALLAELQQDLDALTTPDERARIMNDILQERGRLSNSEQFLVSLLSTLQRPATNRIEIVEPATEAQQVASQIVTQTILGALAGLMLGVVIAASLEYFNDTVMAPEDLMLPEEIPFLGTLEKTGGRRGSPLVALTQRSPANRHKIEGYRRLATRLQELLWAPDASPRYHPPKSVLITATPDNADLSDVIANLGVVLTQLGIRVTLVDANYDRRGLSGIFKLADRAGLSEAALTDGKVKRTTIDSTPDLSIIPSGKPPGSSFALLASENFTRILDELKTGSDLLLIAGPGVSSSDAAVLVQKVDASIVLTQRGKSHRGALHAGILNIDQKPVISIFVDQITGFRRLFRRSRT